MEIFISFLKMLGGLALLIYGMKLLSSKLKKISGSKMEHILTNATDNPIKGLLTGFIITVATQSSAATTVIVVSLVNSGILQLKNAIPIIMGANIGTTINSQILRLTSIKGSNILSLISPATLAPVILLIGLIIMEKAKKQKVKDIGQMIIGLGIIFTGMVTMVSMASTFSNLPIFVKVLQTLSNPFLGLIAGAIITAIVQSSAATVGILQALSTTGIITYSSTIPIILGQNIGTCFTSILASIGANKNAKRVAAVHLFFNLIGTIIFLIVIYTYQSLIGFSFWNSPIDMGGIANFHTIFNIVSTLILFPFISLIEKLTIIVVKDNKNEDEDSNEDDYIAVLNKLDEKFTTIPRIGITNSKTVVEKMAEITEKNFRKTMVLMEKFDSKKMERVQEREDIIDKMEEKVTKYLVSLENLNLSSKDNASITALLRVEAEFEKIGDYVYRFAKTIETMNENDIKLSDVAYKELNTLYNITEEIVIKAKDFFENRDFNLITQIVALREIADDKREKYKTEHIQRLKDGQCNVESGISFLEILTVFDKIVDHCVNIFIAISNYMTNKKFITKHEFFQKVYKEKSDELKDILNEYSLKYDFE